MVLIEMKEQHKDYIYYIHIYSTAEIEDNLFYGEFSQRRVETPELEGEYRIIGNELMQIARENSPPCSE